MVSEAKLFGSKLFIPELTFIDIAVVLTLLLQSFMKSVLGVLHSGAENSFRISREIWTLIGFSFVLILYFFFCTSLLAL